MGIPSNTSLVYFINSPLTSTDWETNFDQIIAWLTDGSADFNINDLTINNLVILNTLSFTGDISMSGDIECTNIIANGTLEVTGDTEFNGLNVFNDNITATNLTLTDDYDPNTESPLSNTLYKKNIPKVWGHIKYTTGVPSILNSFNVSSIVDVGTGICTINFDTDFANANYAPIPSINPGASGNAFCIIISPTYAPAVGSCTIETCSPHIPGKSTRTNYDCSEFYISVFGDQN